MSFRLASLIQDDFIQKDINELDNLNISMRNWVMINSETMPINFGYWYAYSGLSY